MLILRCSDSLPGVGTGFTCLVSVRTLKHLSTGGMVTASMSLGIPFRDLGRTAFLNVLASLSIPETAVAGLADFSAR
jgi:hypothetical protein